MPTCGGVTPKRPRARAFHVPTALRLPCALCLRSWTELSHRELTSDLSTCPPGSRAPPNRRGGLGSPLGTSSPVSPEGALGWAGGALPGGLSYLPGRLETPYRPCWPQHVSSEPISRDIAGIPHQALPGIPPPVPKPPTARCAFQARIRARLQGSPGAPHTPFTSAAPVARPDHRTVLLGGPRRDSHGQARPSRTRPGALHTSPPDVPRSSSAASPAQRASYPPPRCHQTAVSNAHAVTALPREKPRAQPSQVCPHRWRRDSCVTVRSAAQAGVPPPGKL